MYNNASSYETNYYAASSAWMKVAYTLRGRFVSFGHPQVFKKLLYFIDLQWLFAQLTYRLFGLEFSIHIIPGLFTVELMDHCLPTTAANR